ncbi:carboxypeptidase regulatory-like domain-containing protein [Corallococcus praedator]|uniref:Carboxypeptidase regulatory-like domain-containing protein n=1 Tax=Corallococcus praedator TaxID=2316724 RepID=A0ABX9QJ46_9BACT|nr:MULTISPECIES: carboxypeptidase-like regulatory domain-containing protein [Corallococcus]RKH35692.1 carboxypeptidase regulatory-like domain-containing protein [Corallococcus sp. CA031C]RKI07638.1 carboxypeptidase regulatory-like domain-containing protein [Corallococcus praedator]
MNSKILLMPLLALSFLSALPALAEDTAVIEGRVLDASGNPIGGASVTVSADKKQLQSKKTAKDGSYRVELAGIHESSVRCEFTASNFKKASRTVPLASGASQVPLTVKLHPDVVIEDILGMVDDANFLFDAHIKNNASVPKDVSEASLAFLFKNDPGCYSPEPIISYDIGNWEGMTARLHTGASVPTEVAFGDNRVKDKGRAEYGFDYKKCDESVLVLGIKFQFTLPADSAEKVRFRIPRTISLTSNGRTYHLSVSDRQSDKEALLKNTAMQVRLRLSDDSEIVSKRFPLMDRRWYVIKEIKK